MKTFTTSNGGSFLLIKSLKTRRPSSWRSVGRALLVAGLLAALLFPLTAKGIDTDKAAHFGGGYICQHIGSTLFRKMWGSKKSEIPTYSLPFTGCLLIGVTWEFTGNTPVDFGDLGAQVLGQGLFITIDFE